MGKKYVIDETTLTNIGDAIREISQDSTLKIHPERMPEWIGTVCDKAYNDGKSDGEIEGNASGYEIGYKAGEQSGNNELWNVITKDGERTVYAYGFSGWGGEFIRPPFKITPTGAANHMFLRCGELKSIEKQYFDLSKATGSLSAFCNGCSNLEVIEDINFRGSSGDYYYQAFSYATKLHTIERLPMSETTTSADAFLRCGALQNIMIDGVIGRSISFSYSPLTVESMISVITHLKDYSGTENAGKYTLTLKDTCKTLMAEQGAIEELGGKTYDQYITDIGWNLA